MIWKPQPGPQELFHRSKAFEVLYGGQAGGGKSDSLLMEGLRYASQSAYNAIFFRRTFPELEQSVIPRSRDYFNGLGSYNDNKKRWTFNNGSTYNFGHLQHDKDKYNYQSAELSYIAFDELTQFSEDLYLYLFSRARNSHGIPVRIRSATNPGGEGHDWVKRRWLPWLGTDSELKLFGLPRAKSGEVLYFKRVDDLDVLTTQDDPLALSRTFIQATVYDNPALLKNDPDYILRLQALPLIERKRLLEGDWHIQSQGNVFKREWFNGAIVELSEIPSDIRFVRYWDLAASAKTSADYTVGAKVGMDRNGAFWLTDIQRGRWPWPETRQVITQTAHLDGRDCPQVIENVAFQLAAYDDLLRVPDLRSYSVLKHKPDGDKLNRAGVWSARLEQNLFLIVNAPWTLPFQNECLSFSGDNKSHDDQVDAVSGAVQVLGSPGQQMFSAVTRWAAELKSNGFNNRP